MQIIDIDPPDSASIIKTVDTPGSALAVYLTADYAYVADNSSGLQIIDITPPGSAAIVKDVNTPDGAYDVVLKDGFAFVADRSSGIQIIDVEPVNSAYIVNQLILQEALLHFGYQAISLILLMIRWNADH